MIKIINAQEKDLDEILKIYSYAHNFMRETGNPTQWSEDYPSRELLTSDIQNNQLYIGIDEKNSINCVFAFIIGPDKCYARIDNGSWLNDETYGTIHRIASNGQTKNIFKTCLEFCKSQITNIRIDTHHDNKIMQHLIEKNGFTKCGIVYMADNTPRIAYQSIKSPLLKFTFYHKLQRKVRIMTTKKRRIDSYGKLFPLVENKKNTAVYRLSIYLKRKIDLPTLYKAVELTLKEFPDFKVTLKKTFFNYYLEPINNDIKIFVETNDACSKIDLKATNGYIFKISYGSKNINIDFYHILTDGTGATLFTRKLIEHYLDLIGNKPITVEDILYCKDSYIALASSNNSSSIKKKSENSSSYIVKGKYLKNGCNITHLITDLQPLIQFCKKNNITITGYITSILAKSIYETNKEYIKGNKQIKFSIPIDLRKYYDYKTVSNFFEYFNVNITKEEAAKDFTYLFNKVKNTFKEELHAEYFNYRVHRNVKILNQHFTKIIPLFIKKTISNLAYNNFVDSGTVLLSNIGKIPFSNYYQKYIDYAFFIPNPEKNNIKCSICSTNNNLSISFATYFKDNIIENKCYEYLKKEGFNVILKD